MESLNKFKDSLKDSLFWFLGKNKPFIVNDEYKIELLYIDRSNNSAKIRVTNIKSNSSKTFSSVEGSNNA